ncbi:MAG: PaaI family thioesterase [Gammaproteobacteria bacterium]
MSDTPALWAAAGARMLERATSDGRQEFNSFFLSRLLGFEVSYPDNRCVVEFEAIPPLFNPQGTLHGGVLATAMDISMGHLLHHSASTGATLEMKIQYIALIKEGLVTCRASFLRQGRSISYLQSHAFRSNGELVAHATATWKLLRAD